MVESPAGTLLLLLLAPQPRLLVHGRPEAGRESADAHLQREELHDGPTPATHSHRRREQK